ncbi:hypothetical protein CFB34_015060 [Burkholderia sp. HI4860]|uniref:hypothetical protein n=1 Tax=Burkholderia sp. HI4860 TaxID=2015361 RepID=UPI001F622EDA|nr:hypothetical protein [Burkholderia sp. HI4860]MCI3970352.1 hypothetical protein [Burkholderia sp. HI4860]
MLLDQRSISAFASAQGLQRHYLPGGPGDAIFTGLSLRIAARYAASPEREFFSIAAQPRAAGLRGDPADKLKICLETKSGQVNHTGCWDSSYLQICLESKEDKHHGAH